MATQTPGVPVCAKCGRRNPEGFAFCPACGAPVEAISEPTLEERKVVSVLFCDLVGFTADSELADPEDVRARVRPYHGRLRQEVERFGGAVEKFIGDAVMAVFGAPIAHEDDAERAVRTGLRILDAIEELNEGEPRLDLQVRIGIATGEVVVALGARLEQGEGIVTGDVVNTAARLQAVAPVGGVAVDARTFRQTRAAFEYEQLELASVKGKTEPVALWRAWGARPLEPTGEYSAPLVGREPELAILRSVYETVSRSSARLVTIVGEPGVGKSRLVAEFRRLVDDDSAVWRQGRCLPYGDGITFWALGQIVKQQAGVRETDSRGHAVQKLAAAVEEVIDETDDRSWFEARLSPLLGLEPPTVFERDELFAAWSRFFEALASRRPLVLVFEDLHWADDALLDFLEHLVDWATGVPLLAACTARPDLYERRPSWGGGKRNATTVPLSPLTADETSDLLEALLPDAVLPAETHARLLAHCGGNPLYAEEFVRMLADRGFLRFGSKGFALEPGADISVPETIQALIAARLDTLPPERKALLQAAAVVGRVFWAGAVASVAGALPETVAEHLRELARLELVRRARTSSVAEQAEYSFSHALVRDVAYGQIPRADRAQNHLAAAAWIEGVAGDRTADHAELLSHHYEQALTLERAAGADTRELEARAREFLALAGERALRLDVSKAEGYLRRALELALVGTAAHAMIQARMAEAALLTARWADAEVGFTEAIAALQRHGEHVAAGEALVKLALTLRDQGKTAQSRPFLTEAVELLEREPPGPEHVLAYTHMARDYGFAGQPEPCFEWADKAIAAARQLGIEGGAARALQMRAFAQVELGDLDGVDDLRESLRIAREVGLGDEAAVGYINLGDALWWTDGPSAGLATYRAGIDFSSRRGMTFRALWLTAESTWPLFELGEWDEVERVAAHVVAADPDHASSPTYVTLLARPYEGYVRLLRGLVEDAAALREQFLPHARELGDPQVFGPALAVAASIATSLDDHAGAMECVEELCAMTRGRPFWRAFYAPQAVRSCAAAGASELAASVLDEGDVNVPRQAHALLAARAVVAHMSGRLDEAIGLYREAADRWREYGFVLEQAYALLGWGRCLRLLGDARADEPLSEARRAFARLGAVSLLQEADALLEAAGELSP